MPESKSDPLARFRGREEDFVDRLVHRKLAHPLAVLGHRLGVHPNAVSIAGMAIGAASGWFFQFRETAPAAVGVLLLFVATILDNADGQLARRSGKTSELGYILDGLCDNVVFASIYAFSLVGLLPLYGWGAVALVIVGGVSHSLQSAMLDFYKLEYKFWALGSDGHRFKGPDVLEAERARATPLMRAFLRLRIGHVREQMALSRARHAEAPQWIVHRGDASFPARYARWSLPVLRGWFAMGPNWHLIPFYAAALAGRVELYFAFEIVVLNALLATLVTVQARRDRKLGAELRAAPREAAAAH